MNTINIQAKYEVSAPSSVELPDGYDMADIKDIQVKWDIGTIFFYDDTTVSFAIDEGSHEDYKRPSSVEVFSEDYERSTEF